MSLQIKLTEFPFLFYTIKKKYKKKVLHIQIKNIIFYYIIPILVYYLWYQYLKCYNMIQTDEKEFFFNFRLKMTMF